MIPLFIIGRQIEQVDFLVRNDDELREAISLMGDGYIALSDNGYACRLRKVNSSRIVWLPIAHRLVVPWEQIERKEVIVIR